jgi:hypothetical protein
MKQMRTLEMNTPNLKNFFHSQLEACSEEYHHAQMEKFGDQIDSQELHETLNRVSGTQDLDLTKKVKTTKKPKAAKKPKIIAAALKDGSCIRPDIGLCSEKPKPKTAKKTSKKSTAVAELEAFVQAVKKETSPEPDVEQETSSELTAEEEALLEDELFGEPETSFVLTAEQEELLEKELFGEPETSSEPVVEQETSSELTTEEEALLEDELFGEPETSFVLTAEQEELLEKELFGEPETSSESAAAAKKKKCLLSSCQLSRHTSNKSDFSFTNNLEIMWMCMNEIDEFQQTSLDKLNAIKYLQKKKKMIRKNLDNINLVSSLSNPGKGKILFKKGNLYFHGLPEDRADRPWKVGCMWVYHSGVNPKKHGAWVPNLWDFDCAITNTNEYCSI